MSSFTRRIQRKIARQRSDYEPAPQPTVVHPDGGYRTLRPTKGWLEMSVLRIFAQQKLAMLIEAAYARAAHRTGRKAKKVWRKPAPVPEGTFTRQQRRWARRRGLAL